MPRPQPIFSQADYLIQAAESNSNTEWQTEQIMANSADPDQMASSEANWSGSTLFAKAGHISFRQDQG